MLLMYGGTAQSNTGMCSEVPMKIARQTHIAPPVVVVTAPSASDLIVAPLVATAAAPAVLAAPALPIIPTLTPAEALDFKSPNLRAYGDGHTARTDSAIKALPIFAELDALQKTLAPNNLPVRHDLFGLELVLQKGQVIIAGKNGDPDRMVFDPKTQAPEGSGVASVAVSPDGRKIAIATSVRGDDWTTWHVVDAETAVELMRPSPPNTLVIPPAGCSSRRTAPASLSQIGCHRSVTTPVNTACAT
jgi:hypothetical protein